MFILSVFIGCSNMIAEYGGSGDGVIRKNIVGATNSTTLRSLDFTPVSENSVFVAKTGSDSTGTGTEANPVASINHAITLCDAAHRKIVILDSGTYAEKGFEFTGDFRGLYAALGEKPLLQLSPGPDLCNISAATELVSETGSGTGTNEYMERSAVFANGSIVVANGSTSGVFYSIIDENGTVVVPNYSIGDIGSGGVSTPSVTALDNGNWVIVYNRSDTGVIYFQIRNSSGTIVKTETLIKSPGGSWANCTSLENGNWVVTYFSDTGEDLLFQIFDRDGETVGSEGTLVDNSSEYVGVNLIAPFHNGNFVVVWSNTKPAIDPDPAEFTTKFAIFDQEGNPYGNPLPITGVLDPASRMSGWGGIAVLDNDVWVTTYKATDNGNTSFFTIRDSSGTEILPSIIIGGTGITNPVPTVLSNGRWWAVAYIDATGSGKFKIYDEDGIIMRNAATYADPGITSHALQSLPNGNLIFFYTGYYYRIWYPYSWTGIRVSTDAEINGLEISPAIRGGIENLIEVNSALLDIKYSNIKDCREDAAPGVDCYAVYSDSEVNISHSKIYNNDRGVSAQTNNIRVSDSHFYLNSSGYALTIDGAAVSEGDINVNHTDFFNNYGGIRFAGNSGMTEIVRNSIFHNNSLYGINADSSITLSCSAITDLLINVTYGTGVVTEDPRYVNESAGIPDDVDLNIRVKETGYPADSPAKNLADDMRNAGAYDVEYSVK